MVWYSYRFALQENKTFCTNILISPEATQKSPRIFRHVSKIVSTINQNNVINYLQSDHESHLYVCYNAGHHGSSRYRGMILPTCLHSFNLLIYDKHSIITKYILNITINTLISFHYNFTSHFRSINTLNTQFR